MSNKTGGPAFPFTEMRSGEIWEQFAGANLRDYFAAKALQGLLAGGSGFEKFSHLTADAYAIADAMLKEREL